MPDPRVIVQTGVDIEGLRKGYSDADALTRAYLEKAAERYVNATKQVRETAKGVVDAQESLAKASGAAIATWEKRIETLTQKYEKLLQLQNQAATTISSKLSALGVTPDVGAKSVDAAGISVPTFDTSGANRMNTSLFQLGGTTRDAATAMRLLGLEAGAGGGLSYGLGILASKSEILTGILNTAFPVIGIVALGIVLAEVTHKVITLAGEFLNLTAAMVEANRHAKVLAHETETAWEQTQQAVAKHLRNIGHYVEAAKLEKTLLGTVRIKIEEPKYDKLTEQHLGINLGLNDKQIEDLKNSYADVIPTELDTRIGEIQKKLKGVNEELTAIGKHTVRTPFAKGSSIVPEVGLVDPAPARGESQEARKDNILSGVGSLDIVNSHYAAQDKLLKQEYEGLLTLLVQEKEKYKNELVTREDDINKARETEAKKGEQAEKKHEKTLKEQDDQALSDLKATHQLTKQELIEFWQERLAAERGHIDRTREISHTLGTLFQARWAEITKEHERFNKAQEAADRSMETQMSRSTASFIKHLDEQIDAWNKGGQRIIVEKIEVQTRTEERHSEEQTDDKKAVVRQKYESQIFSSYADKVKEAQQIQQIDEQQYQTTIGLENRKLEMTRAIYSQDSLEYARELDQKERLERQHNLKVRQDELTVLHARMQMYRDFFNQLNQQFTQSINSWIHGQQTFAAAMRGLLTGLLQSFTDMMLKMVLQWVESHYLMKAVSIAFSAVMKVLHITDAVTTKAVSSTASVAEILSAAAVAAANAFAATAAIPFVGPELAPAAAAAAYGTVASFASLAAFETGGIVPNTGVALVHKDEAILPSDLTNMLLNVSNPASQKSNIFNYTQHIYGSKGQHPKDIADHSVESLQREMRRRNFELA